MNTHIDTLKAMWDSAERDPNPQKGDLLIFRPDSKGICEVKVSDRDRNVGTAYVRVLRPPKPEPAWHDAAAVIAHIGGNELPRVLVRDNDGAFVDGLTGHAYAADRLRDPAPLIEAKVTDEMAERALQSWRSRSGARSVPDTVRDMLTAALNIGEDK